MRRLKELWFRFHDWLWDEDPNSEYHIRELIRRGDKK